MEYKISGEKCPALPEDFLRPRGYGADMQFEVVEERTYKMDDFPFFNILARCMCS